MTTPLEPAFINELVAFRLAARHDVYGPAKKGEDVAAGACWVVAEHLEERYAFSA